MVLFFAMMIGVIGTIYLEWQLQKSSRVEGRIHVRSDKGLNFRRRKN